MKYIESLSNNPYYNLAFEEYCFKNLPRDEDFVYLWINSPTIVVGKNQNTLEEINLDYVKSKNIAVVRRITGGGAVYHDLGNLNFSIFTNVVGKETIDFGQINIPILKSLEKFGIIAELSGRNDLTLDGKKISGIAQSVWKKRILNHGTILFDTDLSVLSDALNVKADKMESKGVKSVKSRVTNIKPYMTDNISILEFKNMLLGYIFKFNEEEAVEYKLSTQQLQEIEDLFQNRYNKWDWNYGGSPDFGWKNYKRFQSGSIELRLKIKFGLIEEAKIYGDFFGTKEVTEFEEKLNGFKYDKDIIGDLLKDVEIGDYFGNISKEEFLNFMFE